MNEPTFQDKAVNINVNGQMCYFLHLTTIFVKLREREGQGVCMVDGGYPFPDALH